MANPNCPRCDGKKVSAMGSVAYSYSILIEHRCDNCGGLFSITDRRLVKRRADELHRATLVLRGLMQRDEGRRLVN